MANCKCGKVGFYRVSGSDDVYCEEHRDVAESKQKAHAKAFSARTEADRDAFNSRLGAVNHRQGLGPKTHKATY